MVEPCKVDWQYQNRHKETGQADQKTNILARSQGPWPRIPFLALITIFDMQLICM